MKTEAQRKAQDKYQKEKTRQFSIQLKINGDEDIIAKLESVESKQAYIKELIRNDIKKDHP